MKAIITIEDHGDEVNINVAMDPPAGPGDEMTGAGVLLVAAMEAIQKRLAQETEQ